MSEPAFHLVRTADQSAAIDVLATTAGGRVGLAGVLSDLDRTARRTPGLFSQVSRAYRWELRDDLSRRWWPQGITTSADADLSRTGDTHAGRRLVVTTAYAKPVGRAAGRPEHGARITVADITDARRVRYQHVLLVRAVARGDGALFEPLNSHAGGIVWHGRHLHVTATRRGFDTFDLDDVVAVGSNPGGQTSGLRYVLPVRFTHAARTAEGTPAFRYSFLSSVHEPGPDAGPALLAGEYSHHSGTRRVVRFACEPDTGLPALDEQGRAVPEVLGEGVRQMQGAVLVPGPDRLLVMSSSNGRFRRGSVFHGPPGGSSRFRHVPGALPAGPEDLTYWPRPAGDELWGITEYPGRRRLIVIDLATLR